MSAVIANVYRVYYNVENKRRLSRAIESYYTDPTAVKRYLLKSSMQKTVKGPLSIRILKIDMVMKDIMDLYNAYKPLITIVTNYDIDFNDKDYYWYGK